MKVQVTFEIDDEARMGISMARTGEIKPASREVCRDWLDAVVQPEISKVEEAVLIVKREIMEQIGGEV